MSIIEEVPGYMQVLSDGTVKRFAPEISQPTSDSYSDQDLTTGFKSKDIVINPSLPITARIFLPSTTAAATATKPLILYFHGGDFCIGSTTWLGYHRFLGTLSAASQSAILSVDYRLAPENSLPAAYHDCRAALDWLAASPDHWLQGAADLTRVFLIRDSAGGNIAHNVALGALTRPLPEGIRIAGVLPIHPYFSSERRTERATEDAGSAEVATNDMFWRLSLPVGTNRDYFGCNFEVGVGDVAWGEFPAVAVFVAGKDFLKERGVMYARFLKERGVGDVRLVEAEGECHVFHVFYPDSEATLLLQRQISDFIHNVVSP